MKKVLFLSCAGVAFLCTSVTAQKVNTDSLALISQIGKDQLKLGKLQNMVEQKTRNKQNAAADAQTSANDNVTAAQNLTTAPNDKALAKKADSKAGDAKSDARKSRKESARLDELNKNIADLKIKIAGEQAKLSTYSPAVTVAPLPIPMMTPVVSDTTQHP